MERASTKTRKGKPPVGGRCHVQRFSVAFAYPVYFTRDLFAPRNPVLAAALRRAAQPRRRLLAVFDEGLLAAQPELPAALSRYLTAHPGLAELAGPPLRVAGGERAKRGWTGVRVILDAIAAARLCRHSFVLAVGGGSMLDRVGLAASLAHRGVRLIRVPTSVLAQADAGVGVKNGLDAHGMKNFVGTFAPPFAVLNDTRLLLTLPERYWRGGLAEAFKVAIIQDARFFAQLGRLAPRLRARDEAAIEMVVRRTARLHLNHIRAGGDPFEMGAARPLDFGHWAAHKLESLSRHRLGHGEAVAIGIALDSCYAASQGLLTAAERDRILDALQAVGLPLADPLLAPGRGDALLGGLEEFREHLGGTLTITLPAGIGQRVEVHAIDHAAMRAAAHRLLTRHRSPITDHGSPAATA